MHKVSRGTHAFNMVLFGALFVTGVVVFAHEIIALNM